MAYGIWWYHMVSLVFGGSFHIQLDRNAIPPPEIKHPPFLGPRIMYSNRGLSRGFHNDRPKGLMRNSFFFCFFSNIMVPYMFNEPIWRWFLEWFVFVFERLIFCPFFWGFFKVNSPSNCPNKTDPLNFSKWWCKVVPSSPFFFPHFANMTNSRSTITSQFSFSHTFLGWVAIHWTMGKPGKFPKSKIVEKPDPSFPPCQTWPLQ